MATETRSVKSKQPTLESELKIFKDVVSRINGFAYYYVDNIMASPIEGKGYSLLIIPSLTLWNAIMDDEEYKKKITEFDVMNDIHDLKQLFPYGKNDTGWVKIENVDNLYKGDLFHIKIDDHDYDIPINKELFPFKLRKVEYNNLSYKIFSGEIKVLGIRKTYTSSIDCEFAIMRLFKII